MNLTTVLRPFSKILFRYALTLRRLLPQMRSTTFGDMSGANSPKVERVYVINLERQPSRWIEMKRELRHVLDWTGTDLYNLTERFDAIDATRFTQDLSTEDQITSHYTLSDQLFVEPQPLSLPSHFDLNSLIQMSRPEVAVALSHIAIWRRVASQSHQYALILEDDVWFRPGFGQHLDEAWREIEAQPDKQCFFDILYLSYEEVKHGAPKTWLSRNVFRPKRGLWHLSGYIVSREGARRLLQLLPCKGPVDLWINHKYGDLNVLATRRSIITQRRDIHSTNSYSVLPTLTKIGALTFETGALFTIRPDVKPVFAFGTHNSGLSSLAMALSMLGYRCCSDFAALPDHENSALFGNGHNPVFDSYVNIGSLKRSLRILRDLYPNARFILTKTNDTEDNDQISEMTEELHGASVIVLPLQTSNKWQIICDHLRCSPPPCPFPELKDLGQRQILDSISDTVNSVSFRIPKRDKSPWVVENCESWKGINTRPEDCSAETSVIRSDFIKSFDKSLWYSRDDTFTGNLALFRPGNLVTDPNNGVSLSVRRDALGVRDFSAAAFTSRNHYLFGRFEISMQVSNVPGVVSGFFLHRNSPRQEIDIEIVGKRTDQILLNVYWNPGIEGTKYDYGYRGTPMRIDLGFDASKAMHHYAIEWSPSEIRWYVDHRLIHRRVEWDPTPIPHLPMTLHANTWPSRSRELAGRLAIKRLPATTFISWIQTNAHQIQASSS